MLGPLRRCEQAACHSDHQDHRTGSARVFTRCLTTTAIIGPDQLRAPAVSGPQEWLRNFGSSRRRLALATCVALLLGRPLTAADKVDVIHAEERRVGSTSEIKRL